MNAYAVSQYWQRSGQPVSRTNTVGQPLNTASPWIEKKISVILSRAPADSCSAAAAMGRALPYCDKRSSRCDASRAAVVSGNWRMTSCSDVRAAVAVAELDLAVARPSAAHRAPSPTADTRSMTLRNSGSASAILTAHVVRLGEPILRVVGERARRELRQERLERRARLLVLARLRASRTPPR